jgi:hypothetical protein
MVNLNSLSLGLANCTISINDVCSVLSARMSISGAYNQLEVLVGLTVSNCRELIEDFA